MSCAQTATQAMSDSQAMPAVASIGLGKYHTFLDSWFSDLEDTVRVVGGNGPQRPSHSDRFERAPASSTPDDAINARSDARYLKVRAKVDHQLPLKCNFNDCPYSTSSRRDLRAHIMLHEGKRPYECSYEGCSRSFRRKDCARAHARTHENDRKRTQCPVDDCDHEFIRRRDVIRHVTHSHCRVKYSCTQLDCSFSTSDGSVFYAHLHSHVPNTTGCKRRRSSSSDVATGTRGDM